MKVVVLITLSLLSILGSITAIREETTIPEECNIQKVAQAFFDNCEKGYGWDGTKDFVKSEESEFYAQVTDSLPGPPLTDVKTIKGYADWMVGVVHEFGKNATYDVQVSAVDHERGAAIFYAVFAGLSDYVYALNFDQESCLINKMTKIWNDGYAANPPKQ